MLDAVEMEDHWHWRWQYMSGRACDEDDEQLADTTLQGWQTAATPAPAPHDSLASSACASSSQTRSEGAEDGNGTWKLPWG